MAKQNRFDIGINWGCYGPLDAREQAELIAQNGFSATFLGGDDPNMEDAMRALAERGIHCASLHAPFSHINDMWAEGDGGERMLAELQQTADRCQTYGIPVMVVHLSSGERAPHVNDLGYARFATLMEYATARGVTVAYENQRKLANLAFAMEVFSEAKFCWDVGHEECFTHGRRYMPLFGDRLVALHIQDNECMYNADLHLIPYDGKIDFDRVAREIAASNYEGPLMLELIRCNSHRYDDTSATAYFARAAKAAERLREAVLQYKESGERGSVQ